MICVLWIAVCYLTAILTVGSVMEMTDAENAAVTKNFRPKKSNGKQKPGMG